MLEDNKKKNFKNFAKEINHFYGPNTSLLFFCENWDFLNAICKNH
jgi:hypothetical protein